MEAKQKGASPDGLEQVYPFKGPIIIIEENEDDGFLLKRLFHRAGLDNEILCCSDSQEFDQVILRETHPVELIILSLSSKFEPGLELLSKLKADPRFDHTIILTIGNSTRPEDIQAALDLGANGYFAKGIDFGEIATTIQNLEIVNKRKNEQT